LVEAVGIEPTSNPSPAGALHAQLPWCVTVVVAGSCLTHG